MTITKQEAELIKAKMELEEQVKTCRQKDVYFYLKNEDVFQYMRKKCVRIRNANGKFSLDYKELFDESNEYMQKMEEYSTEICDEEQLEKILEKIGLCKAVTVCKERIGCIYKKRYQLSLDFVENLGYFLEIELLSIDADDAALAGCIKDVIEELGIQKIVINKSGYSNMLLQKMYGDEHGL